MTYQATAQPLCRTCGKPIKKVTHTHYFGQGNTHASSSYVTFHPGEAPTDRAGIGQFTNQRVASVRWHVSRTKIERATTWDGESYVDEYFCADTCARAFGYFARKYAPDLTTQAYYEAAMKRSPK